MEENHRGTFFTLSASDADGDPLTVTPATLTTAQGGTVVLLENGDFTYTPAENFNGTDSFNYTLDDGNGGTAVGNVSLTVNPVNDAPVATAPATLTVDEETPGNVALSFTDVDMADGADTARVLLSVSDGVLNLATVAGLTFNAGTSDGEATLGFQGDRTDVLAAIATVTYTPDTDFAGSDTLSFTVDDLGNEGSGGSQTDVEMVAITVNPVNDAPVAASAAWSSRPTTSPRASATAS